MISKKRRREKEYCAVKNNDFSLLSVHGLSNSKIPSYLELFVKDWQEHV